MEKVNEVSRKYPKANYTALTKILGSIPDQKASIDDVMKLQGMSKVGEMAQ